MEGYRRPRGHGGRQPDPVTVVVATRNRVTDLCQTLGHLTGLPERPPVIVVDNASRDGTAAAVRESYPQVTVIRLPRNRGIWARNVGVSHAATRYVAFSDDDSWWEPGSLRHAAAVLDSHRCLGLVAGRTLVGPQREDDALNALLASSPLPRGELPGPRILGFLGCAAVARRSAFLGVGGYSKLLRIGGEELLLAMDLAAAGWPAVYLDEVVARHCPSPARDPAARRSLMARNEALIAWLRRPAGRALAVTRPLLRRASRDPEAARAVAGLLLMLPRALPGRRVVPADIEAQLRMLEAADG